MSDRHPVTLEGPHPGEARRTPAAPLLGFGCASLYSLAATRERRAMLERAYEFGIRHFDVAPMYGLGLAEAELGDFIGGHSDIQVATKFGIRPTAVGRLAGLAQPPIRRVLGAVPSMKAKVKSSGKRHGAGVVGRMLYTDHDYSVANAQRALTASLRALRVDRIKYFLLHEPASALSDEYQELVDYLEQERRKGTIGHWGPAGELSGMDTNLTALTAKATVTQFPYDLIDGYSGPNPDAVRTSITFGFMSTILPNVLSVLENDPSLRRHCSELLDADLADARTVVALLVRDALAHNPFGILLVSSTKAGHLEMACTAANSPLRNEAEVAGIIREKCRGPSTDNPPGHEL